MAALSLRRGVHLAHAGDVAIFLDVDADRYACLDPKMSGILRQWQSCGGPPDSGGVDDGRLRRALTRARLVDDLVGAQEASPMIALPTPRRALAPPVRGASIRALGMAHFSAAHVRRQRVRRPFSEIVARQEMWSAQARNRGLVACDEARLMRHAGQFLATRAWYRRRDACVDETLSLIRFLRGVGMHAYWVIGVNAPPFEAHCWAQAGDLILNDTLDHAAVFTRILVA